MKRNLYRFIFELALIGAVAFLIITLDNKEEKFTQLSFELAQKDSSLTEIKNLNKDYETAITEAESIVNDLQFYYFSEDAFLQLQIDGLENPKAQLFASLEQQPNLLNSSPEIHGQYVYAWGKPIQYGWYIAGFEDGHRAGKALLSYQVKNGKIQWELIDTSFQ